MMMMIIKNAAPSVCMSGQTSALLEISALRELPLPTFFFSLLHCVVSGHRMKLHVHQGKWCNWFGHSKPHPEGEVCWDMKRSVAVYFFHAESKHCLWMSHVINVQIYIFLFRTAVPSVTGLCSTFVVFKQCVWPKMTLCLHFPSLFFPSHLFSLKFSSSLDHIQSQLYAALSFQLLIKCWVPLILLKSAVCQTGQ